MSEPVGIAIVGCGDISAAYRDSLASRPDLVRLVGAFDLRQDAAERLASGVEGCHTYPELGALLADRDVHMVANLTPHRSHHAVSLAALRAGKHVYTEKPLATTRKDASDIVALAEERNLRVACAPVTWLGEAVQTAWKVVRDGMVGPVRVCYAEMNWARIETWHAAPEPFYGAGVGPLTDVGVYPISILTALFGPVDRVSSFGKTVLPRRVRTDGERFSVLSPDVIVAGLEFDNGVLARVTASFYVGPSTQQGIEIHGDEGSLHVASSVNFASPVMFRPFGPADAEWTPVPPVCPARPGVEWGRGIFELVEALREDRPNRGEGRHGLHVVDICCSATESAQSGRPVRVMSTFAQPSPMAWAL